MTVPYGTGKPLIIIAGQSNATGHGNDFYLDPGIGLVPVYNAVQFNAQWSNNPTDPIVWNTLATTGLQPYAAPGAPDMGVELGLGHALYDAGCAPFIGKFAIDAAGLQAHYLPTSTYPTAQPGHNLFSQLCDYITARQTETGSTLAVLVWIQGETDAYDAGPSAAYQANLVSFVTGLRALFGNFAFVFNKLNASVPLSPCVYRDTVRAGQAAYAATDANSYLVNVDDIPLGGAYVDSALHYDANSATSIGYRLAQTIEPLVTRSVYVSPTYLGAGPGDFGAGALSPRWGGETAYQANDIAILAVAGATTSATASLSTAAGFTQITTVDSLYTTQHQRLTLFWCRATSALMTTPVVAATNTYQAARIFVFRGCVTSGSPVDVSATAVNNTYATGVSLPGATTVTDRTLVAMFSGNYSGLAVNAMTIPASLDFPSLILEQQSIYRIGSDFQSISVAVGEKRNAGAFSAVSATSAFAMITANITIALKPGTIAVQPAIAGQPFPVLANATTSEGIRDRILTLIEAITPAAPVSPAFRRYRNEEGGDFRAFATSNAAGALRRVQVRDTGEDHGVTVSNTDYDEREVTFTILIAYPQTARAGKNNALDRDDCSDADFHKIDYAIGIYGRVNFTVATSSDCTPLGLEKVGVEHGNGVDILVLRGTYRYLRLSS